jgi:hypothetical protein
MRNCLRFVFIAATLLVIACHKSGQWHNDPENFERAWGQPPPQELRVLHSWYWRSAHFTREEAYYFHFAPERDGMQRFIAENKLELVRPEVDVKWSSFACFDKPAWFAPKPRSAYNIWVTPSEFARALVAEDKTTREFFLSACQL